MSLRWLVLATAFAFTAAGCGSEAPTASATKPGSADGTGPRQLHGYNWSDYVAPDTIARFESDTGIQVVYDVFDSNEILETKLLTGKTGYDVVVPSASFLERQIAAGVFMPLDRSRLPNLANLDRAILAKVARHDPGNRHAVPYLWGTTGIGYDVDRVEAATGAEKLDSWAAIFDPDQAARLASCGIALVDSPSEIIDSILIYLGLDPNADRVEDLSAAGAVLATLRPHVRYIDSSRYISDLANGEICVAVGWTGDVLQARDRAAEAGTGRVIRFAIPREGALLFFDMLAIPRESTRVAEAHAFIDYLMRPDVIASISNFVNYANANTPATALMDESVRADPAIYPTAEVGAKLHPHLAEPADYMRALTRTWTRFKTGR